MQLKTIPSGKVFQAIIMDITQRTKIAKQVFDIFCQVWRSDAISSHIKLRILYCNVDSTIVWPRNLVSVSTKKIQSFMNESLYQILQIKQYGRVLNNISNQEPINIKTKCIK